MSDLLKSVDARTQLAGQNQLEVLLFSLGEDRLSRRSETFGINVFKVREVMKIPTLAHAPDSPAAIEGMASLRGQVVPVINLPRYCRVDTEQPPQILIITEYNRQVQGFLVRSVDAIVRLDWENVKVPPSIMVGRHAGMITAIADLDDGRLLMVMDVERVLDDVAGGYHDEGSLRDVASLGEPRQVLFADDSVVARGQIRRTLEALGLGYIETRNGSEAWERLRELADSAQALGTPLRSRLAAVLTDIEMPETDGYVLTQRIKADTRFDGIPVVMHSSLSGETNQAIGRKVGADAYVAKFDPRDLALTLSRIIAPDAQAS